MIGYTPDSVTCRHKKRPADLTNRAGHSTRKEREMIIPMIDYLSFGVDTERYQDAIDSLSAELNEVKETAKERLINKVANKTTVNIAGVTFEVLANGAQGYAYILNNDEYQIKLAQYRSTNADFYPIKIIIHSPCLWSYGPENSFDFIIEWVASVFGEVSRNKVSRVDLCCHTDLLTAESISPDVFKGQYKNSNMQTVNRKNSGITFGSRGSKIYCRIYDKTLEVRTKNTKLWFFDIWAENGFLDGEVWNIEFELKREFFVSNSLESVEALFQSLRSIWEYCTQEWLVMIERDRTRTENCSINKVWEAS